MYRSILVAVAILSVLSIRTLLACTCIGPQHEYAIQASSVVFAAQVLGIEDNPDSIFKSRFRIHVLAVWKGEMPETTYVDAYQSSACGYPFEAGRQYLIYMTERNLERLEVGLCSGTNELENLYYDRFLLGDPITRYDTAFETVTLELMLDLVAQEGPAETSIAWQFSYFKYEANLLLPRLLHIANGSLPGNRLAALRAIRSLGKSASDAYPFLASSHSWWGKKDSAAVAERLLAMASVCEDYARMKNVLVRMLVDDDPVVRRAAVRSFNSFRETGEYRREMARHVRNALYDVDAEVRFAAIRWFRYYDGDGDIARRVKKMSLSDPDQDVRYEAFDYLKWRERWSRMARKNGTVRDRGFERSRSAR